MVTKSLQLGLQEFTRHYEVPRENPLFPALSDSFHIEVQAGPKQPSQLRRSNSLTKTTLLTTLVEKHREAASENSKN